MEKKQSGLKWFLSQLLTVKQMAIVFGTIVLVASCTNNKDEILRFGICADVHKDKVADADQRLAAFIDTMESKNLDFIIQLGDFCQPIPENDTFLSIWNSYAGEGYHVLGNHDMDGGATREQTVEYYNMPSKYYSFDAKGFHFMVLDGNDVKSPPQKGYYAHYIGQEQIDWIIQDIESTELPVIVFSHQTLEFEGGVENAKEIRDIFEKVNRQSPKKKVIACFAGHHHVDCSKHINGIYYIYMNSMSYFWMGQEYVNVPVAEKYPELQYTAPYEDPLFAVIEIDPEGSIGIQGRQSTWVGMTPWELNYKEGYFTKEHIAPRIKDRKLDFTY